VGIAQYVPNFEFMDVPEDPGAQLFPDMYVDTVKYTNPADN
jgi:hypothetical protein